jgi:hypothetical protein
MLVGQNDGTASALTNTCNGRDRLAKMQIVYCDSYQMRMRKHEGRGAPGAECHCICAGLGITFQGCRDLWQTTPCPTIVTGQQFACVSTRLNPFVAPGVFQRDDDGLSGQAMTNGVGLFWRGCRRKLFRVLSKKWLLTYSRENAWLTLDFRLGS